jgi:hypothetical protein
MGLFDDCPRPPGDASPIEYVGGWNRPPNEAELTERTLSDIETGITVVTEESDTGELNKNSLNDDQIATIQGTNFESSFILVIQVNLPAPGYTFNLTGIVYDGGNLGAYGCIERDNNTGNTPGVEIYQVLIARIDQQVPDESVLVLQDSEGATTKYRN